MSREEKFLALVSPEPNTGCWFWVGRMRPDGYGAYATYTNGRKVYQAHRLSYELFNGPIPQGAMIRHKCDVRDCVNPAHLIIGSAADNGADCKARGRTCKGEKHGGAKLNVEQVIAIRALLAQGVYQRDIAKQFGIAQTTVHHIHVKRNWA